MVAGEPSNLGIAQPSRNGITMHVPAEARSAPPRPPWPACACSACSRGGGIAPWLSSASGSTHSGTAGAEWIWGAAVSESDERGREHERESFLTTGQGGFARRPTRLTRLFG